MFVKDETKQADITSIVNEIVPNSLLKDTFDKKLIYALPLNQSDKFAGKAIFHLFLTSIVYLS